MTSYTPEVAERLKEMARRPSGFMRLDRDRDAVDLRSALAELDSRAGEIERLRKLGGELTGALNFIIAFYEPQTYLDTNAWKQAEAGGRVALAKGKAEFWQALGDQTP